MPFLSPQSVSLAAPAMPSLQDRRRGLPVAASRFGMATSEATPEKLERTSRKFIPLPPKDIMALSLPQTRILLNQLTGKDIIASSRLGKKIAGPMATQTDGKWLQKSNLIGIHPRLAPTYLDMVKYAMSFPEDAVHLLPVLQAGAGNSLYAPASWNLSREFMSPELTAQGLDTPQKQLKFAINSMHALGKSVGLDVQSHTDRYSETVFAFPEYFEWIRLNSEKNREISNADTLHEAVQEEIRGYLRSSGDANGQPVDEETLNKFFTPETTEEKRLNLLFGPTTNESTRMIRRLSLMNWIRDQGFETIPVPIFYHHRPIKFMEMVREPNGVSWAKFEANDNIEEPYPLSFTVFGSITPFKLYHSTNGIPDTTRPNLPVWDYYANKIATLQKEYGFDFLRVDMPYTNTTAPPAGSEASPEPKAFWAYVKQKIQAQNPSIATLAEAFFDPRCCRGVDGYQNIEASQFEVALGNMQYQAMDQNFLGKTKGLNLASLFRKVTFSICQTMMTDDSDKPKFNYAYGAPLAKQIRAFIGLFLNQTSYMGQGFETRDLDPSMDNRNYSCHFIDGNVKDSQGNFQWGQDQAFFNTLTRLREQYTKLKDTLNTQSHYWLDNNHGDVGAWTYSDPKTGVDRLFVLNTDANTEKPEVNITNPLDVEALDVSKGTQQTLALLPEFSTDESKKSLATMIVRRGTPIKITNLGPGEGRIYRVIRPRTKTSADK